MVGKIVCMAPIIKIIVNLSYFGADFETEWTRRIEADRNVTFRNSAKSKLILLVYQHYGRLALYIYTLLCPLYQFETTQK